MPTKRTPATQLPWVLSSHQGADELAAHPTALHSLAPRFLFLQPHPCPHSHFKAGKPQSSACQVRHHTPAKELHFHQFRGLVASNDSLASLQAMASDIVDTCVPLLQRLLAVLRSQLHLRLATTKHTP